MIKTARIKASQAELMITPAMASPLKSLLNAFLYRLSEIIPVTNPTIIRGNMNIGKAMARMEAMELEKEIMANDLASL